MTSQLLDDVAVRQATLDDKAAVLAINEDIADGRDYLPALYDYHITSPNAQMFVLLLKDEIVSAPNNLKSLSKEKAIMQRKCQKCHHYHGHQGY